MLRTTCRIWQSHILGVLTELPTCCGSPLCAVHRYLCTFKAPHQLIPCDPWRWDIFTGSLHKLQPFDYLMKSCELHLLRCIVSQPTNLCQTNFNLRCDRFPSNRHCLLFWDFFLPLNCKQTNPSKISQKFLLQPWCLGILIWKIVAAVVTLNREAATLPKVLRSQLVDSLRKPNARNRQHLDLPDETLLGKSESALVRSQANCAKLPKDHDQALSVYIRSVHEASSACAWLLWHCHLKSWLVGDACHWGGQPWSLQSALLTKLFAIVPEPPLQ